LNEEVKEVRFPNKAKPTDVISGITYVSNIRTLDTAAGSLGILLLQFSIADL
jgi:hypothetical protein